MDDIEAGIDGDEERDAEASATATAPRSETRYPLAYDANGNPLHVPSHAVAWRVRRGGGKRGRPRNVFDSSTGRQLEIALGASVQDLAETNVPADRYLLYPIDSAGAIIPGVVAVTEVSDEDEEEEDERGALVPNSKDPVLAMLASLQETIKSQHEVIKSASDNLSRALGSAVSGYAPVRAVMQPAQLPAPIVMEQAPPPAPAENGGVLAGILNMKPEQLFQLAAVAQQMFATIKAAATATGAANGATVVDSAAAFGGGAVGGGP